MNPERAHPVEQGPGISAVVGGYESQKETRNRQRFTVRLRRPVRQRTGAQAEVSRRHSSCRGWVSLPV